MNSEQWLNETLWCGDVSRSAMIWRFTAYGLLPFLASRGYTLRLSAKETSCAIATLLYYNRGHTLVTPLVYERDDDYSIEHKQHYNHMIDPEAWSILWNQWLNWDDVSSDYGFYRRLDIQEFCWSQIDLNRSPHTPVVEAFMEGDDGYHPREDYDD